MAAQPGILADVPSLGRHLLFSLVQAAALPEALTRLATWARGRGAVVGLGPALIAALDRQVPGLREFAALQGPQELKVPATPAALWCWLRAEAGEDAGDLVLRTHELEQVLAPALRCQRVLDSFRHGRGPNGHGRDLTGYEDGTENPQGDEALSAALVQGQGPGLDGGSFVAVQQWVHDFAAFEAMTETEQDHMIGRRRTDNEELDDAPESAHVKRTAQESFEPEAFVLRRSMPWAAGHQAGLMFVAFGKSFDAFEAQMRRMAGLDDGVVDAIFRVSRPVSGAHFWCPPSTAEGLNLTALGLA